MKKLVILGGSGIGMIAAHTAELLGWNVLGFLNDNIPAGERVGKYRSFSVLGGTEKYYDYLYQRDTYFFIAYVGLGNEKLHYQKLEQLEIPPFLFADLIHPTANIPENYCKIGKGCLFGPHSQISPDTTISDNCILLGGSFVGHDTILDRFAHVATNGVVGANVWVGKNVHIGSNATVREKVRIGDYSLIGSGCVVLEDIPENTIMVGNPARPLKK